MSKSSFVLILLLLHVGNSVSYMKNSKPHAQHLSDPIGSETEESGDPEAQIERVHELIHKLITYTQALESEYLKLEKDYFSKNVTDLHSL